MLAPPILNIYSVQTNLTANTISLPILIKTSKSENVKPSPSLTAE